MTNRLFTTVIATALVLVSPKAKATGFAINENGAKALGMGNAFTAIADNPSAIFFNPAGLAQLDGLQLEAGVSLILPGFGYTTTSPTTGGQVDVNGETLVFPVPAIYASYRIHDMVAVGLGAYAPFGLGIEWPNTVDVSGQQVAWWGRDIVKSVSLQTFFINPTVAVKLHPRILLGAGFNIVQGAVTLERSIMSSNNAADDIQVKLSAGKLSFGGTAGLLIKAVPNLLNLGVSYRSAVPFTFEGNVAFTKDGDPNKVPAGLRTSLVDGKVKTTVNMPHTLSLGIAAFPIEDLAVGIGLDVTTWSSFDELAIEFLDTPALSETTKEQWHNTIALRIGTEFKIKPNIPIRLGFVFDQSPVPETTVSPVLPDADRYEFTVGAGYEIAGLKIDFGYLFLFSADHETADNTVIVGKYRTMAHVLSLSLGYKFGI